MATPATHLLERIAALIERSVAAKIEALADRTLRHIGADLYHEVVAIVVATADLLDDVVASFSGEEEDTPAGLTDVAWLSRGEVVSRLEALRGAHDDGGPAWQLISLADAALERCERALVALEIDLREHEQLPPSPRSEQRLRESREVRRLYTALRRTFLVAGSPTGEELLDELWAIGAQLDAIRALDAYGIIRVDDRRQLRSLRARITAALAADPAAGEGERRALWQDLSSFAVLLMSIHDREDLRAHDLRLVRRLQRRLADEPRGAAPRALLQELAPLLGRDAELDRLLITPTETPVATCEMVLQRLEIELGGHGAGF